MTVMATQRIGRPRGAPTKIVRLPVAVAEFAKRLATNSIRAGDISAFLAVEARTDATVPLMISPAVCGFPSPADDYMDRPLDFNELLITNEAATFAVRIRGDSMTGVGLFPGDYAIINRALNAVDGSVILALLNGAFTIKRYRCRGADVWLQAENPAYANIYLSENSDFQVWGVVKNSIRNY